MKIDANSNIIERIGHMGDTVSKWDNGLYVDCCLLGTSSTFLIDSGSTATLLSDRIYFSIPEHQRPRLNELTHMVKGANGADISVHGYTDIDLELGGSSFKQSIIVCDILPDGVLGQDFLLKFANKIDYKKLTIDTGVARIPCWIGGETEAISHVLLMNATVVPPLSSMLVTVELPNFDKLSGAALVTRSRNLVKSKNTIVVEGVIDATERTTTVRVINVGDIEANLPATTPLGTCESFYDTDGLEPEPHDCTATSSTSQTECKPSQQLPDHLQEMWNRSITHLTETEAEQLAELLTRYQHAFAKSSEDLGRTDRVMHRINTGTSAPCRQPPRRQPIGKRDIERQEVQKMLERKVIEPSNSSWSSPIVLVTKKDGSTRFCVDYRRVNDLSVKDAYPIPRVDDCLDALSGSCWFSCMDLNSGFWQIGLDPADKDKTAFATTLGLYQFTVLPFGLANAPSTFERLMEDVLRGLQWEICLVYMDDIIVPSATFNDSITRLELVFHRLSSANLKLKPSKCIFFQREVKFLGHLVSEHGIGTDLDKIKTVRYWPVPISSKQVRSFLGLCSYYRRFVHDFAKIARPLHKLCDKGAAFIWDDVCQTAFDTLKEALTTSPILAYPEQGSGFILDTDASDHSVGGIVSQVQNGHERVIAYMSKALSPSERIYCVTRKELLAVVAALRTFHSYLYGQKVLLRTDNAAVSWMRNLKQPTGQVARWLQELGTYDLDVVHRPGKKHTNADALSRRPCKACSRQQRGDEEDPDHDGCHAPVESMPDIDDIPPVTAIRVNAVTRSQGCNVQNQSPVLLEGWEPLAIRQNQLDDSNMGPVLVAIEDKQSRPEWASIATKAPVYKTLWRCWDRLQVHSGILYRRWIDDETEELQLIVPETKRNDVMRFHHDIPSAAHLDAKRTLERIKRTFYWPAMKHAVTEYCRQCDACAARKPSYSQNKSPLGSCQVGGPMEKVAVDVLGPLPMTRQGNRFILVIVDTFTKWTEAVAIPNQETSTITRAFIDNFASKFGAPLQLHSDQGRNFEARMFQEMCDLLQIEKTRTTSLRPQANGVVERFNRTLTTMLSMYCREDQSQWDVYLQQALMAYRASSNSSTGKTPNMMLFGREVVLPMQAVLGRPMTDDEEHTIDPDDYIARTRKKLVQVHDQARLALKKNAEYRKLYYDTRGKQAVLRDFKVGQAVWLHDPARRVGVCSKLSDKWKGPYLVTRKLDDLLYLVKRSPKQPAKAFHVDRLLPYRGRNLTPWIVKMAKSACSV